MTRKESDVQSLNNFMRIQFFEKTCFMKTYKIYVSIVSDEDFLYVLNIALNLNQGILMK